MKENYKKRKAEDILTDDILVDEIENNICSEHLVVDDEFALASGIYSQINKIKNPLDPKSKQLIGEKIVGSINAYKRRNLFLRISTAAILLLIVGISVLFEIKKESEIRIFANNSMLGSSGNNTRLILSGEEIQINSVESKIAYAGNGRDLQVDSTHVKQVVDGDKMVFNTVIVPFGRRTQITLSDNSSVWLNSGSKLIFPARFASDKREVYLEGEAIFEVSHNKQQPFHVITHKVEVKVLGTVFDVCAYNDDATTSTILEKGSVELKYDGNSIMSQPKVVMVPGTMAVYDPKKQIMQQLKVNTHFYTSWREGYLVFERQSLGEILKKISRYYDVPIQLQDKSLENETFSGNLDLRNSAFQVLEVIGEIISAKIEKNEDKILITRI